MDKPKKNDPDEITSPIEYDSNGKVVSLFGLPVDHIELKELTGSGVLIEVLPPNYENADDNG